MKIKRWSPFRDIDRWELSTGIDALRREMYNMFEQLFPTGEVDFSEFRFVPLAEMEETDDSIQLKLDIPGLDPKDLSLEVTEDTVSISGERKQESKSEENGHIRSEIRYGKFARKISLPCPIECEEVKAEYKHGNLNLTLPKSKTKQREKIKIDVIES